MEQILFIFISLAVLIAWGIARIINKIGNRGRLVSTGVGPNGIGGWLQFLIVSLVFIGPLVAIARTNGGIYSVEATDPSFIGMAQWKTFKTACWWTTFIDVGMSIYIGIVLMRGQTMIDVRKAQVMLWIRLGIGIASTLLLLIFIFGRAEITPEVIGSFIVAAVSTAIWSVYLSRSKRVKATYSEKQPKVSSDNESIPVSKMLTSVAIIAVFFGFGLFQISIGAMGISHEWGRVWAAAAIFFAISSRFTLPLTIGSFFYALHTWDWHWVFATLFALPGIVFAVPSLLNVLITGMMSPFRR
ncbi:MAG: DUF2569 family protein [Nitrospirae bacterium]|nr:DUF2569 family protein [Magnetococcales bacterium]